MSSILHSFHNIHISPHIIIYQNLLTENEHLLIAYKKYLFNLKKKDSENKRVTFFANKIVKYKKKKKKKLMPVEMRKKVKKLVPIEMEKKKKLITAEKKRIIYKSLNDVIISDLGFYFSDYLLEKYKLFLFNKQKKDSDNQQRMFLEINVLDQYEKNNHSVKSTPIFSREKMMKRKKKKKKKKISGKKRKRIVRKKRKKRRKIKHSLIIPKKYDKNKYLYESKLLVSKKLKENDITEIQDNIYIKIIKKNLERMCKSKSILPRQSFKITPFPKELWNKWFKNVCSFDSKSNSEFLFIQDIKDLDFLLGTNWEKVKIIEKGRLFSGQIISISSTHYFKLIFKIENDIPSLVISFKYNRIIDDNKKSKSGYYAERKVFISNK